VTGLYFCDNDAVDCTASVAPVDTVAWTSARSLADEPACVEVPMAYTRVAETNNTAIQGNSQRTLVKPMRANAIDRVMARPLQSGRPRR
jgi:hypothetical protein